MSKENYKIFTLPEIILISEIREKLSKIGDFYSNDDEKNDDLNYSSVGYFNDGKTDIFISVFINNNDSKRICFKFDDENIFKKYLPLIKEQLHI